MNVFTDPYKSAEGSDAIVICTEWDEFTTFDYKRIYEGMNKVLDSLLNYSSPHFCLTEDAFSIAAFCERLDLRLKLSERLWDHVDLQSIPLFKQ